MNGKTSNGKTSIKEGLRRGMAGLIALGGLLVCAAPPVAAQSQSKPGVYNWGDNASGQLAQGGLGGFIQVPVRPTGDFSVPGALSPFSAIAVAGGEQHSMALLADGRVATWGDNTYGQLGRAGIGGSDPYARIIPNLPKITAIAAGGFHCLAIDQKGGVWAWGRNDYGQIGDNSTTTVGSPVRVFDFLYSQDLLLGVVAIAAGEQHSLAVLKDGTVRAWGLNNFGQLGVGVADNAAHPLPLKVNILNSVFPILDGVVIAAGGYHSLALQTIKSSAVGGVTTLAFSWGANGSGQLGNGTFANLATPTPVQDGTGNKLTAVKAVSGGLGEIVYDTKQNAGIYAHSMFLMNDGVIRDCGYDRYGQLGDGTFLAAAPYGKPFPVVVIDGATGGKFGPARVIAAGGLHSLANRIDATTWAWGHNNLGQLGTNTAPADKPTPLRTLGANGAGFLDNSFTVAGGGRHSLAIVGVTYAGKIQLEGCVNAAQSVTFLFRPLNGSTPFTRTATLTPSGPGSSAGYFALTDIPQQSYEVHIKGPKWLATNGLVDTTAGNVTGMFAFLRAGDANDDNSCDTTDFGILVGTWNLSLGDAGYDDRADFNCDLSVDTTDFGLLVGNYNVTGDL